MFFVFLVGTAGSGKSLLTASLEKWLVGSDLSVTVVNLDPGVEDPPYTSDVDIREHVDYGEVMNSFGLGPNGALVASLDMAVGLVGDLRDEIVESLEDFTEPGTGEKIVEKVYRREELYHGDCLRKAPDLLVTWKGFEYNTRSIFCLPRLGRFLFPR